MFITTTIQATLKEIIFRDLKYTKLNDTATKKKSFCNLKLINISLDLGCELNLILGKSVYDFRKIHVF